MTEKTHPLIIIGSGPAGLTAAIYAARAELNPMVLEGHQPGGQLMGTNLVENWPGNISILGPKLMMNMRKHAKHFGAHLIKETITKVNFSHKPFSLLTDKQEYKVSSIIIATGAGPKRLNCTGEKEYWGKGVTICAICDGALYKDQPIAIVGGGNTAMENALVMSTFTHQITIIHILDKLTATPALQKQVLNNPNIKVIYNSTVSKINGDGKHMHEVIATNTKTNETHKIPARALFLAIGIKPNTSFLKGHLELDDYGYIKTMCPTTATSVNGVFACGDAADYIYRQAITAAGTGCMAACDAQRYLTS